MADSIKEKIFKDIETKLAKIKIADGYDNDIAIVERFKIDGQTTAKTPFIIIIAGDVTVLSEGPDPLVTKQVDIILDVVTRQDPVASPGPSDALMNSLEADIERALQVDITRGGNAYDTSPLFSTPLTVAAGQPDIESVMEFSCSYKHKRGDPTSL